MQRIGTIQLRNELFESHLALADIGREMLSLDVVPFVSKRKEEETPRLLKEYHKEKADEIALNSAVEAWLKGKLKNPRFLNPKYSYALFGEYVELNEKNLGLWYDAIKDFVKGFKEEQFENKRSYVEKTFAVFRKNPSFLNKLYDRPVNRPTFEVSDLKELEDYCKILENSEDPFDLKIWHDGQWYQLLRDFLPEEIEEKAFNILNRYGIIEKLVEHPTKELLPKDYSPESSLFDILNDDLDLDSGLQSLLPGEQEIGFNGKEAEYPSGLEATAIYARGRPVGYVLWVPEDDFKSVYGERALSKALEPKRVKDLWDKLAVIYNRYRDFSTTPNAPLYHALQNSGIPIMVVWGDGETVRYVDKKIFENEMKYAGITFNESEVCPELGREFKYLETNPPQHFRRIKIGDEFKNLEAELHEGSKLNLKTLGAIAAVATAVTAGILGAFCPSVSALKKQEDEKIESLIEYADFSKETVEFDKNFKNYGSLTENSPENFSLTHPFYEGWNLFGMSLKPENAAIEAVFKENLTKVDAIYGYKNGSWSWYIRGIPSVLKELEGGRAYWVKASESFNQTLHGIAPKRQPLIEGWSLIALNGSVPILIEDFLPNVAWDYIYGYNAKNKDWDYYLKDLGGDLTAIKPTQGYWMYLKDTPLTVKNFTLYYTPVITPSGEVAKLGEPIELEIFIEDPSVRELGLSSCNVTWDKPSWNETGELTPTIEFLDENTAKIEGSVPSNITTDLAPRFAINALIKDAGGNIEQLEREIPVAITPTDLQRFDEESKADARFIRDYFRVGDRLRIIYMGLGGAIDVADVAYLTNLEEDLEAVIKSDDRIPWNKTEGFIKTCGIVKYIYPYFINFTKPRSYANFIGNYTAALELYGYPMHNRTVLLLPGNASQSEFSEDLFDFATIVLEGVDGGNVTLKSNILRENWMLTEHIKRTPYVINHPEMFEGLNAKVRQEAWEIFDNEYGPGYYDGKTYYPTDEEIWSDVFIPHWVYYWNSTPQAGNVSGRITIFPWHNSTLSRQRIPDETNRTVASLLFWVLQHRTYNPVNETVVEGLEGTKLSLELLPEKYSSIFNLYNEAKIDETAVYNLEGFPSYNEYKNLIEVISGEPSEDYLIARWAYWQWQGDRHFHGLPNTTNQFKNIDKSLKENWPEYDLIRVAYGDERRKYYPDFESNELGVPQAFKAFGIPHAYSGDSVDQNGAYGYEWGVYGIPQQVIDGLVGQEELGKIVTAYGNGFGLLFCVDGVKEDLALGPENGGARNIRVYQQIRGPPPSVPDFIFTDKGKVYLWKR